MAELTRSAGRDGSLVAPARFGDRSSLRRGNLAMVLRLLRDGGPRSRAGIAEDTGLPKPTVTSLVAELVELGLVAEGEVQRRGAVGRPALAVHLDGRTVCGIGIEVSADYIGLVARSLDGRTLFEARHPVDVAGAGPDTVLDLLAERLTEGLESVAAQGARAVGATLVAPGVVDIGAGRVDFAANIAWRGVDAVAGLSRRLGPGAPPLTLENDAKAGAVAEYLALQGSGIHDLLYITGETGIGGGIISDGRLLRGATGFAGEIGHMPLDPGGAQCACGRRGCWETMVGLGALLRLAADDADPVRDPSADLEVRLAELRRREDHGDQRTCDAFGRVADHLGLGIALLTDVLNPRAVVLGGYFTYVGDLLLPRTRAVMT
ncbi:MAG: ROK family transcriptional regulator, partial [Catenulispora sp.]|nr:ROK family transcriptional regulator [Catenulispora sp.]